jgi:hypothetical protein
MVLVAVALGSFFLGHLSSPFLNNQGEFLVELMRCRMDTQEDCSFVAMPDSSFTHIQFLYASHVK